MSGSVNQVTLIGNLGRDPEIRTTQDGREIANLAVATSESWRDRNTGERKEKTEWHRVVIFNEGLVGVVKSYVERLQGFRAGPVADAEMDGSIGAREIFDGSGAARFQRQP